MQIVNCIQGSEEWIEARIGLATGSKFKVLQAKASKGSTVRGKTSKDYMKQLAAERLTGLPCVSYKDANMDWGTDNEAGARVVYQAIYGVTVDEVGFVQLDDNVGVSPDGLVGDDGMIEIKCPKTTTHIDTILRNKVPAEYIPQIQGNMWVCDRQWCDFISFDPRMKSTRIWVIRVERDQKYIDNLKREVIGFVLELKELIEKINANSPF